MKKIDPLLRHCPRLIAAVYRPIQKVITQLEVGETVNVEGRQVIFRDEETGQWYDLVAALRGVIHFNELAESRHQLPIDLSALIRFTNKLELSSPIFETELDDLKVCINACKVQASKLRVSQAASISDAVAIRSEIDRLKGIAA